MTFGERLKELLDENDISQRQLAIELNIAYSTLNGYLNNYRQPDYQQLISIAHFFHVSTDYLLGASPLFEAPTATTDNSVQRLFHYYERLNPDMKELALEIIKNMYKFNNLKSSE